MQKKKCRFSVLTLNNEKPYMLVILLFYHLRRTLHACANHIFPAINSKNQRIRKFARKYRLCTLQFL